MTEVLDDAERLRGLRRIDELRRDFALASYKPYQKQRAFHAMGQYKRERALMAANRVGKAQPLGTKIATPNGWTNIEDLRVTDYVLGHDGAPTRVLGVFFRGTLPIYRVTTWDKSTTLCAEDHLWTVFIRRKGWVTVTTKELTKINLSHAPARPRLPNNGPAQFTRKDFPIDPYIAGLLLGDGSLLNGSASFTSADLELVEAMGQHFRMKKKEDRQYDWFLLGTKNKMREAGIYGKRSWEKVVPHAYLLGDAEQRLALLQGLMDTDGTCGRDGDASFCSTSENLARAVAYLARSLGGYATVNPRKKGPLGKHDFFIVQVGLPLGVFPFRVSRKRVRYRREKEPVRIIHSIKFAGAAECVCISVEAKDGLYITEDFIVTHNTKALSCEVACHMTGWYPPWWEGLRYAYPIRCGIGSKTAELTRDGAQRMLLGEFGKFGTGAIPKGNLLPDWKLSRGVPEAIDIFRVKHISGGVSIAVLKSYHDGREAWQADEWDIAWLDEEPPEEIYSEAMARTAKTKSGRPGPVMISLTPLLGMTEVVSRFYPDRGHPDRGLVMMTIEEAEHFDEEARRQTIEGYLPHEREARAKGIPMLGSGRIFPIADELIAIAPIAQIPPLWRRLVGIDFGWDHPSAIIWGAYDDDADVLYIYDCHRGRQQTVVELAAAIRSRGDWIPVAWPRDGLNETAAGPQLAEQYRAQGINMLPEHAQYDVVPGDSKENPMLARNSVEAGVNDMLTRMQTGRLKVYSHLTDWFDEFHTYHRQDGKIVKKGDDLLAATRYLCMQLRFAQNNMKAQRISPNRGGNWRTL